MPSRKPSSPVIDTSEDDASPSDALKLAEQAEADAAEAEAVAAAARARARAIRLRREAEKHTRQDAEADSAEDNEDTAEGNELEVHEEVEPAADSVESGESDQPAAEETEPELDAAAVAQQKRPRFRRPSRRAWKFVAVGVATLLILTLLVASGFMFWQHRKALAEQRRAAEFSAAARQGVVTLMSLDFNHAKEDVQRIIDSSTGQFKEDFQSTAEDFVKVAESSKAVTETTVSAAAVDSMTDDSAVVLVAAASRVTNAAGAKQDPRTWRLSVTLNRDGDQMKLSKVEFVP